MIRTFAALLLPAALLLLPAHTDAQWARPYPPPNYTQQTGDVLPGNYTNVSNGGNCAVRADRRGYVFINENGTRALFVYDSPNRLHNVAGGWDPNTYATVSRDSAGRTMLRFDEAGTQPSYWVSQ